MRTRNHRTWSLKFATVAALATLAMQSACGAERRAPDPPLGAPLPTPAPASTQPATTSPATPPSGGLDTVFSSAAGFVTATGWVTGLTADTAVELTMTIDGMATTNVRVAGPERAADVAAETVTVGFGVDSRAPAGERDVCMSMLDPMHEVARSVGCERVTVGAPAADDRFIELTAITPHAVDATVEVRGILEAGLGAAPAAVSISITSDDGRASTTSATIEWDTFRSQLATPGNGLSTVCPIGPDDSFEITCGTVVVGDVTAAATGSPTPATAVEPPIGHPLNATRRDAGVSVRLSDGSVMWFFGDTSEWAPTGTFEYFVNNTAAWATAADPAVTLDAVDQAGEPFEFVTPTHDFCEANTYPKPVYWPEAAVSIPQIDGTDRVLVFVSEVCVGVGYFHFEAVGMALVEIVYDASVPPAERRLTGRVVADDIATIEEPYGRAAVLSGDNHVYVYQCGSLIEVEHQRCTVARVPAHSVADTSTWRYWNGRDWTLSDSWSNDPAAAAAVSLPPGTDIPMAALTLTYDEMIDAYVMAYSPAPVYCDRIAVRIAVTPVGPWTPALEVFLPDCAEIVGNQMRACYAATVQPAFSRPGLLGLGYFDQYVADSTGQAEYYTVTAPVVVAVTRR